MEQLISFLKTQNELLEKEVLELKKSVKSKPVKKFPNEVTTVVPTGKTYTEVTFGYDLRYSESRISGHRSSSQ